MSDEARNEKRAREEEGRRGMAHERCGWATTALSIPYHDHEWGRPVHDDRVFFEFLILEGAQAGLSWETILKKRERYREVYAEFDASRWHVTGRAMLHACSRTRASCATG
jgi:3-methyladenine DNA glycosylase Tag